MNLDAIEKVKYVNRDALGFFNEDDEFFTCTPKRSANELPQRGYKTSQYFVQSSSPQKYN